MFTLVVNEHIWHQAPAGTTGCRVYGFSGHDVPGGGARRIDGEQGRGTEPDGSGITELGLEVARRRLDAAGRVGTRGFSRPEVSYEPG